MNTIKYVLLAISHPSYQLAAEEVAPFLKEKLPEYIGSNAKTAWLSITGQLTKEFIRNAAIQSFGHQVSNDNVYTYRTISFSIPDGDGRIFIVYEK